jgi:DnaJ-class molecular chaperone
MARSRTVVEKRDRGKTRVCYKCKGKGVHKGKPCSVCLGLKKVVIIRDNASATFFY